MFKDEKSKRNTRQEKDCGDMLKRMQRKDIKEYALYHGGQKMRAKGDEKCKEKNSSPSARMESRVACQKRRIRRNRRHTLH